MSRNNSKTNLSSNYEYKQEFNQLEKKVKLLKQRTVTKKNQKKIKTLNTSANPKNEFQASASHLGQKEIIKLISVINIIKQIMTTKLQKTFEDTITFQSDPAGPVINLGKKSFYKNTFKL